MLNLERKIHGLCRLMVGLFAMQVLVAGLCPYTPSSHLAMASDIAISHSMVSHCDIEYSRSGASHSGHDLPCSHCDQPDELIQNKAVESNLDANLVVCSTAYFYADNVVDVDLSSPTHALSVTSPPSRTPLYLTTQRIRI